MLPACAVFRDSWESVVELQSQRARQQGQSEFEIFISNTDNLSMPVDHVQLQQTCAAAKKIAFTTFDSICIAPNSRLRSLLKQHIHDRTHALREQNLEVSRSLAHRDALAEWTQMKADCCTCAAALQCVIALTSSVSSSNRGPGVWEGVGRCTADVILPDVIAIARTCDFESSQAHALERDALLRDVSAARMQGQEAVHKVEALQVANDELQQQRARLIAEKAAVEEAFAALKDDLDFKSRELQSLRVSSDSAKETLLLQLDALLQKNTSYAAQVHMLETDVRAGKERECGLQASMQQLQKDFRERETQLVAQVDAAAASLDAASDERGHARVREEEFRVECTLLKQRLQNASEAAAADVALMQQQLKTARDKVISLGASRNALEAALSQREQEHSDAIRSLTTEFSQKEAALESRIFQQSQLDVGVRQQLQEARANCLELEKQLRQSNASHQQLMQSHTALVQVHGSVQAQLESVQHAHDELKAQANSKMQQLLQDSTLNQQELHELQLSLQQEQSRGQDAILAGTEVLHELARLKLQMCGPCSLQSHCDAAGLFLLIGKLLIRFAERTRRTTRKSPLQRLPGAKRANPRALCRCLPGNFAFAQLQYLIDVALFNALMIRRDSLKFQPISLPETPQ